MLSCVLFSHIWTGQFRYPGVTRYVHDLSTEIGEHLENITAALVVFVEVGVPTIKFGQKHGTANLVRLFLYGDSRVVTYPASVKPFHYRYILQVC